MGKTDANPRGFNTRVRALSLLPQVWATVLTIVVDYTKSLYEMIWLAKFDGVDSDINARNFPLKGSGKQAINPVFVTGMDVLNWLIVQGQAYADQMVYKWVTTNQAIAYLVAHGLSGAMLEHLLFDQAFCATHPELQKHPAIVALGSVWIDGSGTCYRYPYLRNSLACGRELFLIWVCEDDVHWGADDCFIAVHN